jgi:hypothetical protein
MESTCYRNRGGVSELHTLHCNTEDYRLYFHVLLICREIRVRISFDLNPGVGILSEQSFRATTSLSDIFTALLSVIYLFWGDLIGSTGLLRDHACRDLSITRIRPPMLGSRGSAIE